MVLPKGCPMAHENDLICPFCFTIFPEGALDPDVPICRECNTFGRAVVVESYPEFTSSVKMAEVEAIRQSWEGRAHFLEAERELILRNIDVFLAIVKQNG
jgi:hypothetical protein